MFESIQATGSFVSQKCNWILIWCCEQSKIVEMKRRLNFDGVKWILMRFQWFKSLLLNLNLLEKIVWNSSSSFDTAYQPSHKSINLTLNLSIDNLETDTCWHIEIRSLMSVRLRDAASLIVMLARWDDTQRIIIVHWCSRQQHPQLLRETRRHRHLHKINQTACRRIIQAAAHQQ